MVLEVKARAVVTAHAGWKCNFEDYQLACTVAGFFVCAFRLCAHVKLVALQLWDLLQRHSIGAESENLLATTTGNALPQLLL